MNKVEIKGKVSHLESGYKEVNGEDLFILRFAVEVTREGSKTQIDPIPCRVTGAMAEDVKKDIKNGDTVSIKGRWNVDKILNTNGEVIHYCACIPQVIMLARRDKEERGKDLSIR